MAKSFNDYKNSEELETLKQEFLLGKKPQGCERCWKDESAGLPSKRVLDNQYIFNDSPALDEYLVISMPFGNTCNLACRICSSYASSRWAQENRKLLAYFPNIPIYNHQRYYRDSQFMNSVKSITKSVRHIEFPGGEPFLAGKEQHLDFLDHLVSHNASNISLHYITNGTQMPSSEFIQRWSQFKKVDIQVSIDGTHNIFEYNRWPAKWEDVYMNVKYFNDGLRSVLPNLQISISHSVSVFTIWNLQEFVEWCRKENLPDPYLGLVSRPSHYSITILPDSAKEEIAKRLIDPSLEAIKTALWAPSNLESLDTMMRYVKILDKHRYQSFPDTFPELYQLMGEKCQTLYQLY